MNYSVATVSSTGRRSENQDDVAWKAPDPVGGRPGVVAVADGMGGTSGGQIASSIAIATVLDRLSDAPDPSAEAFSDYGEDLIRRIHERIKQKQNTDQGPSNMQTTLTSIYFSEQDHAILHLGDCRCYCLNSQGEGTFTQLTVDHHSSVKFDEEDQPEQGGLTRSLGGSGLDRPDILVEQPESAGTLDQNTYLICSDGLYGHPMEQTLRNDEIADLVTRSETLGQAALWLISESYRCGSSDNITVALLHEGDRSVISPVLETPMNIPPDTSTGGNADFPPEISSIHHTGETQELDFADELNIEDTSRSEQTSGEQDTGGSRSRLVSVLIVLTGILLLLPLLFFVLRGNT